MAVTGMPCVCFYVRLTIYAENAATLWNANVAAHPSLQVTVEKKEILTSSQAAQG